MLYDLAKKGTEKVTGKWNELGRALCRRREEHGATWSGGRCPCPWQGGWNTMIFKVPYNPDHPMIPLADKGSYCPLSRCCIL